MNKLTVAIVLALIGILHAELLNNQTIIQNQDFVPEEPMNANSAQNQSIDISNNSSSQYYPYDKEYYREICKQPRSRFNKTFFNTFCKTLSEHKYKHNSDSRHSEHMYQDEEIDDEMVMQGVFVMVTFIVFVAFVCACIKRCFGGINLRIPHMNHSRRQMVPFQQVMVPISQLPQNASYIPNQQLAYQPLQQMQAPIVGIPIGQGKLQAPNTMQQQSPVQQQHQARYQPSSQQQQPVYVQYFPQQPQSVPVYNYPMIQRPQLMFVQQPQGYFVPNQNQNFMQVNQPQVLQNQQPPKQEQSEGLKDQNCQQNIELQDMNNDRKYPCLDQKMAQNQQDQFLQQQAAANSQNSSNQLQFNYPQNIQYK